MVFRMRAKSVQSDTESPVIFRWNPERAINLSPDNVRLDPFTWSLYSLERTEFRLFQLLAKYEKQQSYQSISDN